MEVFHSHRGYAMARFQKSSVWRRSAPFSVDGHQFFRGRLAQMELVLAPNKLLRIRAEKNNV